MIVHNLIPVVINVIIGTALYLLIQYGAKKNRERYERRTCINTLHHFDIYMTDEIDECLEKYLRYYVETQGTQRTYTRKILNTAVKYYLKKK